jgi:hypothetical protein
MGIKGAVRRLRQYDGLDWMFFTLSTSVLVTVSVFVAVALKPAEPPPWNAISYVIPAQVITEDNYIAPSYSGTDEIPIRLTRLTDCMEYRCDNEAIAVEITARWELIEDGVLQTKRVTVLDAFESSLLAGIDYFPGDVGIFTTQLNPFPIPPEVTGHTAVSGGTSTWRIGGIVQPLVENADPVVWRTQTITIES